MPSSCCTMAYPSHATPSRRPRLIHRHGPTPNPRARRPGPRRRQKDLDDDCHRAAVRRDPRTRTPRGGGAEARMGTLMTIDPVTVAQTAAATWAGLRLCHGAADWLVL